MKTTVVTGAGGFIGGALVADLRRQGHKVRAVDIKPLDEWFQRFDDVENLDIWDLREFERCRDAVYRGGNLEAGIVYNLAADMGGMGFIENNRAACMVSVLINTNLLRAAVENRVERYFFASSACVYDRNIQMNLRDTPLKESDVYPYNPELGYGEEKLFSEWMCRYFREDFGFETRIARFHNVYGPHGTWQGGREKAPAAICRKVIEAKHSGKHEIEIWGSGMQTRSFMYIDDAVKGIQMIMNSGVREPINLGSSESISIDGLVGMAEDIAGIKLKRTYKLDAPKGVNGRNSDNTMIRRELGWEPNTPLREGLRRTYNWIEEQYKESLSAASKQ